MLDSEKVLRWAGKIHLASVANFPSLCATIFKIIDDGVGADNRVYQKLQEERSSKWASWGPEGGGGRRWRMPTDPDDAISLAWDLFRTFSENPDDIPTFQLHMYHQRSLQDNLDSFLGDFFPLLEEGINAILSEEEGLHLNENAREKQQKFQILDAPNLLSVDLEKQPGQLGRSLIYLDLDNFKALNTKFTERRVDEIMLPIVHHFLKGCMANLGYAYAEGGDEFILLLPNSTELIGLALAEAVRSGVQELRFEEEAADVVVSASLGLAWQAAGEEENDLPGRANDAKRVAKQSGKNCVAVWRATGAVRWPS